MSRPEPPVNEVEASVDEPVSPARVKVVGTFWAHFVVI